MVDVHRARSAVTPEERMFVDNHQCTRRASAYIDIDRFRPDRAIRVGGRLRSACVRQRSLVHG